ncbi:MAG: cell division protein FtsZ [Alphaproteobacteria bacterium]
MTINLSVPQTETELKPRITVVGVGGAGCNAVNNMINLNLGGVEFTAMNTDAQSLAQSGAPRTLQLGTTITQGLGAGSRPEVGRASAEEAIEEIMEQLGGSHMLFITAGMGGGTGTGAAPVIARAARDHGLLTVGVVTKPFHFEGTNRMRLAEAGIEELQQFVDTLIVIPNQNLFRVANEKTTFADAFAMADNVLYSGVRGITDLMVMPGLINLDFADIRAVMSEMGKAMMGTGEGDGDKRATDAAEAAISNPLLDDVSMKGARGVLINITGGMDMTLYEVDEAANRIREEVDPEANIIFGSTFDEAMEGQLRVSVVATGIDAEAIGARHPEIRERTEARARLAQPTTNHAGPVRPAVVATTASPAFRPSPVSPMPGQPQPVATGGAATAVAMAEPAGEAIPEPDPETKLETKLETSAETAGDTVPEAASLADPETPGAIASDPAAGSPAATVTAPGTRAADQPFIPPRPVQPAASPEQATRATAARPDPFAEAAMANGGRQPDRPRSNRPGLFGFMGSRQKEAARDEAPESAETPTEQASAPAPSLPKAAPGRETPARSEEASAPARPREVPQSRMPVERAATGGAESEDDLLDIPAFLRRQAN